MSKKTMVRFVVKGGKLKGQTLEREMPDFDFQEFINVPNLNSQSAFAEGSGTRIFLSLPIKEKTNGQK